MSTARSLDKSGDGMPKKSGKSMLMTAYIASSRPSNSSSNREPSSLLYSSESVNSTDGIASATALQWHSLATCLRRCSRSVYAGIMVSPDSVQTMRTASSRYSVLSVPEEAVNRKRDVPLKLHSLRPSHSIGRRKS